jgi:hypothetical protein
MGSTVAAGAVGVVMTLQVVIGPPTNWTYSTLAGPLSQEALPADEALLVTTEESTAEELAPLVESLDGGEPDLFHPDQEAAPATET